MRAVCLHTSSSVLVFASASIVGCRSVPDTGGSSAMSSGNAPSREKATIASRSCRGSVTVAMVRDDARARGVSILNGGWIGSSQAPGGSVLMERRWHGLARDGFVVEVLCSHRSVLLACVGWVVQRVNPPCSSLRRAMEAPSCPLLAAEVMATPQGSLRYGVRTLLSQLPPRPWEV